MFENLFCTFCLDLRVPITLENEICVDRASHGKIYKRLTIWRVLLFAEESQVSEARCTDEVVQKSQMNSETTKTVFDRFLLKRSTQKLRMLSHNKAECHSPHIQICHDSRGLYTVGLTEAALT